MTKLTKEEVLKIYDRVFHYHFQQPHQINNILTVASEIQDAYQAKNADQLRDAEIWKFIEGFDGVYQVSTKGRIRSVDRTDSAGKERKKKYLKPSATRKGYLKVTLWSNGEYVERYVHRLVASAFCDQSQDSNQVNHIDGDTSNNDVSNLEWVNASGNALHAARVLMKRVTPIVGTNVSDGSVITFDSFALAEEAGFTRSLIDKCIKGKRTHHKEYSWAYAAMKEETKAQLDPAVDSAMKESK